MTFANNQRTLDKVLTFSFLIVAFLSLATMAFNGAVRDIFKDDAYYYLLTAINYVKEGFFTFDTINPTNGFHPLYEWVLTAFVWILGPEHERYWFYIANILFILLLIGIFVFALFCFAQKAFKDKSRTEKAHVYTLLLLIGGLLSFRLPYYVNGMESVFILIGVPTLSLLLLEKRYLWASIAAMFMVATRLDTLIFFVSPLFLVFAWSVVEEKKNYKSGFLFLLKMILPAAVFVLFYMLFNQLEFGHTKPIHGSLKSTFPVPNPQIQLLFSKNAVMLSLVSLIGIGLSLKPRKLSLSIQRFAIAIGLITFVYILNFVLFQKWSKPIPPWYFSIVYITSFTSFLLGLTNILSVRRIRMVTTTVFVFLLFYQGYSFFKSYDNYKRKEFTHDSQIRFLKTLPEDAILANTDSGFTSYWSERKVINLDGLINNFEYQDYLGKQELDKYLSNKQVDYLIVAVWETDVTRPWARFMKPKEVYEPMYKHCVNKSVYEGDYEYFPFYVYSYLNNCYSDSIDLYSQSEVWRSESRFENINFRIVVFDLKKNGLFSQTMRSANEFQKRKF